MSQNQPEIHAKIEFYNYSYLCDYLLQYLLPLIIPHHPGFTDGFVMGGYNDMHAH